jgi:Tfp pilus assembly protein PilW
MFKESPSKRINEAGFSLVELMIVSVVLLTILSILAAIVGGVQSNYNARRERSAQMSDATAAMDLITRVLRNAGNNTTQVALTPTGSNRLIVKGDWNPADGALDDPFENVEFLVSGDTLNLIDYSGATPITSQITEDIYSIYFQYLDANGNTTATMAQVSRVRSTITIGDENARTITSDIAIRNRIQPK